MASAGGAVIILDWEGRDETIYFIGGKDDYDVHILSESGFAVENRGNGSRNHVFERDFLNDAQKCEEMFEIHAY